MQNLNEDYKNYYKQRLVESILVEEVERYEDEAPQEAGFFSNIARLIRPSTVKPITSGGKTWLWNGLKVPDHVRKSVKNGGLYRRFERQYLEGRSLVRFRDWLADALHYDEATGQWFRRSSDGWKHITKDGKEIPIPFNPTQGIPSGWQYSIPAGLFFELTPQDQQGTVEGTPNGTPGGIEALAPYRMT